MRRAEDPPNVSPDGRYSFAIRTWERRNNELLESLHVYDHQREWDILMLDHELLAEVDWGAAGQFELTVWHPAAPDQKAKLLVDAPSRQFRFAGKEQKHSLRLLDERLREWWRN